MSEMTEDNKKEEKKLIVKLINDNLNENDKFDFIKIRHKSNLLRYTRELHKLDKICSNKQKKNKSVTDYNRIVFTRKIENAQNNIDKNILNNTSNKIDIEYKIDLSRKWNKFKDFEKVYLLKQYLAKKYTDNLEEKTDKYINLLRQKKLAVEYDIELFEITKIEKIKSKKSKKKLNK